MQINNEELVDALIYNSLRRHIPKYGLEGIEQVIKEVYDQTPFLRDKFLKQYRLLLNVEK